MVEGVHTVKAVYNLAKKFGVEMPISEAVYKVVHEGISPQVALEKLLSRPVKEEDI